MRAALADARDGLLSALPSPPDNPSIAWTVASIPAVSDRTRTPAAIRSGAPWSPGGRGMLCLACLARRVGRPLTGADSNHGIAAKRTAHSLPSTGGRKNVFDKDRGNRLGPSRAISQNLIGGVSK
jgi:hypothetical protein